jgi:plasmid stabilization system protein ParE
MAALTIRWTRQAIVDVDNIYDFIATSSPRGARAIVDRIDRAIMSLTVHPRMGRPGRVPGSRELVVPRTRFIVAYRLRGQAVEVLGVIHAARRWPQGF